MSLSHGADGVVQSIARAARRHGAVERVGAAVAAAVGRVMLRLVIRHEARQRVRRSRHVVAVGRAAHSRHAPDVRQQFVILEARSPLRGPHLFRSNNHLEIESNEGFDRALTL